jgi:4-alpha-glucanotransferase
LALRAALQLPASTTGCSSFGDDTMDLLRACLDHMAGSPALFMAVDLEDLWLEREPQNRPGTGPDVPNWRLRSAVTLEQARGDGGVVAALTEIDRLRREPAREAAP